MLLRSDGSAVAIGGNESGQGNISTLAEEMACAQVSAGGLRTVLLRSDGCVLQSEMTVLGQCDIPPLQDGMVYTQIFAGAAQTVLLGCDGSAVGVGGHEHGQCDIPTPEPGICYVDTKSCGRDLALQVEFACKDDAVSLISSTLAWEKRFRLTAPGGDSAWETHKRIAREVSVNLPNLQLILPDGQLLARRFGC